MEVITPDILPPETAKKKRIVPPNCRKPHGALSKKTKRALRLAVEHGVDPKEALTLAGDGKIPSPSAITMFKEKVRKHSLTSPRMVKMAHQAITDTLKMKPIHYEASKPVAGIGVVDYTETIMPTVTNRLAAASMVMDRDQPTINRNVNLNINADLHPVDLSKYCNRK